MPTVRSAQPMPAELTSTRSGAIDLAISTAATMSSVLVTSTRRTPADLRRQLLALLFLQVGDDDLGASFGELPGDGGAVPEAPPVTITLAPVMSISCRTIGEAAGNRALGLDGTM